MDRRSSITVAVLASLVAAAAVADPNTDKPAAAPHVEYFKKAAGTWDATLDDQGQPSKGTETVRVLGDGLWAITDFEGAVAGTPFKGHGVSGYDAAKKKYVGIWVDTMSPFPMHTEGELDATGNVLTTKGVMPDPMNPGQTIAATMVETWTGTDKRVFTMSMTMPDGQTMETLKITYTRRK